MHIQKLPSIHTDFLWLEILRRKDIVGPMGYSEELAQLVRDQLGKRRNVVEKKMMGGLTFMVNDKMCVGVLKDRLMCRVGPERYDAALKRAGASRMDFTGKPMVGFVFVDQAALRSGKSILFWIDLCLEYNKTAPAGKKRSKKR